MTKKKQKQKIDMGDEGVDIVDKLQGSYDLAMESCTSALDPFEYLLEAKREIERLRDDKRYLADAYYGLLEALRDLPVLPSPDVLLTLSHAAKYPEDWETGKFLQRERGLRAVPPKTECELGAGWWNRVVNRPVPR